MPKAKKETPATDGKAEGDKKTATQKEMVEAALAAGVKPTSNIDLSDWITKKYGTKLTPQQIAQVKTTMAGGSKSRIMKQPSRIMKSPVAEKKAAPAAGGGSYDLTTISDAKALAERCGGADKLKKLLDVIG